MQRRLRVPRRSIEEHVRLDLHLRLLVVSGSEPGFRTVSAGCEPWLHVVTERGETQIDRLSGRDGSSELRPGRRWKPTANRLLTTRATTSADRISLRPAGLRQCPGVPLESEPRCRSPRRYRWPRSGSTRPGRILSESSAAEATALSWPRCRTRYSTVTRFGLANGVGAWSIRYATCVRSVARSRSSMTTWPGRAIVSSGILKVSI